MSKLPADAAAVNARFITGRRVPAPDRSADTLPAPLPASLDPDAMRRIARLWQAVRRLDAERRANDPAVIDQEFLVARLAILAELAERTEREGIDAVLDALPPAPKIRTFTELAFNAWWRALVHRGLTDADALLLAVCIWHRLPIARQHKGAAFEVAAFLEELAAVDPQTDLLTDRTALYVLLASPAKTRGRGRPKGRDPETAAAHETAGRELFATRQAQGRLTIPTIDPWHVVHDPAAVINAIVATDRRPRSPRGTKTPPDPLADNSALRQAWFGDRSRSLPSLRRRLVIEALADHCLKWWLDEDAREAGPFTN